MSGLTVPHKVLLKNGRVVNFDAEPIGDGFAIRCHAEDGKMLNPQECAENILAVCHHFNMAGHKVVMQTTYHITPVPMTRAEQAKHRTELNKAVLADKPTPWWVRTVMKLTVWMALIGILFDSIGGNTPWYKAVAYIATILIIVPCICYEVMRDKK